MGCLVLFLLYSSEARAKLYSGRMYVAACGAGQELLEPRWRWHKNILETLLRLIFVKDDTLHSHRRENFKSYTDDSCFSSSVLMFVSTL
jgi:hypothetical protein